MRMRKQLILCYMTSHYRDTFCLVCYLVDLFVAVRSSAVDRITVLDRLLKLWPQRSVYSYALDSAVYLLYIDSLSSKKFVFFPVIKWKNGYLSLDMAYRHREEIVGKRFLSVKSSNKLKTNRISEWEWRAGVVRAVSHKDCQDPELAVSFYSLSKLRSLLKTTPRKSLKCTTKRPVLLVCVWNERGL